MRKWLRNLSFFCALVFIFSLAALAKPQPTIDRVQLVSQQLSLLKNRLSQAQLEYQNLIQQKDFVSQLAIEKASKNLLDKAALDISVARSNLDSIKIELSDALQSKNWLEKNIQDIENQLNVLNIFHLKLTPSEQLTVKEYRSDVKYQAKLLQLEKTRIQLLQGLEQTADKLLGFKLEKYQQLNKLLKTRNLLRLKQQQAKDELFFQEQQNMWLSQLNDLYSRLAKVDPAENKKQYAELEREIFYANENANFAYIKSLIARYKDQLQQMRYVVVKSGSINLLNELNNQLQSLSKQVNRLSAVMQNRNTLLSQHIEFLSIKQTHNVDLQAYIKKLTHLSAQYHNVDASISLLVDNISQFRKTLEKSIQNELSSRQGLPLFSVQTFLDLGKEILLAPALTYQIVKSLSLYISSVFQTFGGLLWTILILGEMAIVVLYVLIRRLIKRLLSTSSKWHEQLNSKWITLQWFNRNLIDLFVVTNVLSLFYFLNIPWQNYRLVGYLLFVWLSYKTLMTILRICLVETTHDTTGHDVKFYHRLKWIISVGTIITAITVFVHQLPLIYELRTLCDRLFLFLLMVVSILLIRSKDVLPNLILSNMEAQHPYLQKCIRLVCSLVPLLLFANSVIGILGFVNLIMTVSWYEGIFLVVLVGYLILRGLLSDAMEQMSRLMIHYVNNGWLWTEAFLKPVDKILRVTLFLSAWALLFLLYGWDQQSPIVERLLRLLNYQLLNILNTTITPLSIIELFIVVSFFYWIARWTREFVYRLLLTRTKDLGIRNTIAILSQYTVVVIGAFLSLRVLGIDLHALTVVASAFALGVGLGLRDLANNFASGFLLLFERPLRVGDIITINNNEGEVKHIGSRAVTIRTWDHMELVVPNSEFFTKSFINWTAKDNIVRSIVPIKISRHDNPHEVKILIQNILANHKEILKDPVPEVYLKEMNDTVMEFEIRYYVNIRQVSSRLSVISAVLTTIWDVFLKHGIKPPYPQHEVLLKSAPPELPSVPSAQTE